VELYEFAPKTAASILLPDQEVILCPIGDIQLGSPGCEVDRLKAHIAWAEGLRKQGKSVYYLGMGDYIDADSPSNRKRIKALWGDMYDSTRASIIKGREVYLEEVKKILAPTVGHWIGLLSGHHIAEFEDGTNGDSRLAQFLKTKYLGSSTMLHLRFRGGNLNRGVTCKIWAHHGEGSGQSITAPINKVMQRAVPYWFANLYLIGHYHSKATQPIPWIESTTGPGGEVKLKGTTRYIVSTGGWLAGYAENSKGAFGLPEGNYIEKAMLAPHTLGAPVIFIRPKRTSSEVRIDLNVSV